MFDFNIRGLRKIKFGIENAFLFGVNSSTPQPERRGLLRVDPERRFYTHFQKRGWYRRMGQGWSVIDSHFNKEDECTS